MNHRKAKPEDISEMLGLFRDTIKKVCINDYSPQQINAWLSAADDFARWEKAVMEQFFIVAEENGKITGFASLENGSYIDFLYVHKDHQGKGIAKSLLNLLLSEAKAFGTHTVYSNVSKTARSFFERNNFKVIHTNHNILRGVEIINYRMELTNLS